MRRLSQQEAMDRILAVHSDEYEYPNFLYTNARGIINSVCKRHGPFEQTFNAHVYNKTGCPLCYGNEIVTTESFITASKLIYGDKYDYSLVEYRDAHTKVKIICPHILHGIFEVKPNHHIASQVGCPYCAGKLTTELFIEKAKQVHRNKYDYSKTVFVHCNSHVEIICPTLTHGSFFTRPLVHLDGRGGCINCAVTSRVLPLSEFLERATELHDNEYDYSLVAQDYKNSKSKVNILCKHHGVFQQEATRHLSGQGCPNCNTYVSKGEIDWLNSLSVPEEYRQKTIMLGTKKISVDAYDPETKTIYEFYGDYWHGNPNVFKPDLVNTRTNDNKTMSELYANTMSRETLIKDAGYKMVSIWESDWKANVS